MVHPDRFAGKVVVVTGAAQGLGEAVATRAAREGAAVACVDRSDLVHEVAGKLAAEGAQTIALTTDLERYLGASTAMAAGPQPVRPDRRPDQQRGRHDLGQAVRALRRGGDRGRDPALALPHDVVLPGVLPIMLAQGRGVIVNVSSVATRGLNRVPYAAAKGGVNALTASLAWEYAEHGIRVVATAPGGIAAPPRRVPRGTVTEQTDEEKAWYQTVVDQTESSSLLHRYGTLAEQAAPILFLASDEASYITGTRLPVAGGDLG